MPHITAKETLALLRTLAGQGTARRFVGLRQDMEGLSAQLAAAANAPLGETPDVADTLQDLQLRTAEVQKLGEQAESGLGQLAGVFSQLGLENELVLRSEREEVPPKLYIDVETGIVVEGRIAGRFPEGQILNAVAALAEAKAPISQSLLSRVVYGEKAAEKGPWLRSWFSVLNGRAEELGLPEVVDSPGKHARYVLGSEYEVLGRERTFYPQADPEQAEPLPSAPKPLIKQREKRTKEAATSKPERFFYGATVTERTGIPRTALDLMGELGVLKEGVHYVRRGERDIRAYTEAGVTAASDLAKFAKKEKQGRFTERLVRDAFRIPSEQQQENPYGENGPKTVDDAVEYFLVQTALSRLPTLRENVSEGILAGEDEALKRRLEELKRSVLASVELENVGEKRRLAAATAFDLITNRRPFNFLVKQRPGLALVGELIDYVREVRPGLLREFPEAVINPPSPVARVDSDGRVNGSTSVGPMGDRRR